MVLATLLSAAQCKVEVAQEESDGEINNLTQSVVNASRGRRETEHLNIMIHQDFLFSRVFLAKARRSGFPQHSHGGPAEVRGGRSYKWEATQQD